MAADDLLERAQGKLTENPEEKESDKVMKWLRGLSERNRHVKLGTEDHEWLQAREEEQKEDDRKWTARIEEITGGGMQRGGTAEKQKPMVGKDGTIVLPIGEDGSCNSGAGGG